MKVILSWLGRSGPLALVTAPLVLALLTRAPGGGGELELARALVLLVCLAQLGGALARLLRVGRSAAERAVAGLLFAATAGATLATTLGACGLLRAPLLLNLTALAALVVSAAAAARRPEPSEPERAAPPAAERLAIALAVALCAITLLHDLRTDRFQPPGAQLYDDVSYHLPAAVLWLESGDLRMIRFDFGDRSTSFYPIFGELMSCLLLAGFTGSDFLARWSQLPAAVGLLLAAWGLARRCGTSAWGALFVLLLTLSVPRLFPELALSAGNDVWAAFFALAALLAAWWAAESSGSGRLVALAACLGALAGTKYLTLFWMPWLIGAALLAGAFRGLRALPRAALARQAGAAALTLVVTGGFAYARNGVTTGNPFFPQPLTVAGATLLPGWDATALGARRQREAWSGVDLGAFASGSAQLGPIWGRLLLPATMLLPLGVGFAGWRRARTAPTRLALAVALGPLWSIGVYAVALHDHRDVRYALAAVPLAAVALASLADRLDARWRWALGAPAAALALWAISLSRNFRVTPALAVALVAASLTWLAVARRPAAPPLAVLGCLLLAVNAGTTLRRYAEGRSRFEPAARALERLTAGRGATIAYVGGNRPYFLYGERLQNRVEIAPSRGDVERRHYRWGGAIEPDPFAGPSREAWYDRLRLLGVDYAVVDADGESSRTARWLLSRRAPMARVESGEGWQIFGWRPDAR